MLLFMLHKERFEILMYNLKELINLLCLRFHAFFYIQYLICHFLISCIHVEVNSFGVKVDFMKEYFTNFDNFIMSKTVIWVINVHFEIRVNKIG